MRFAPVCSIVVATAMFSGCATTTEIVTATPGATIVREKDGEELGVTPYSYTTTMWIWESEKLTVTSVAGEEKTIEMKRATEVDPLPMVGGVCLSVCLVGIPVILAAGMKLPETTTVTFDGDPPKKKSKTKQAKTKKHKKAAVVAEARDDDDDDSHVAF